MDKNIDISARLNSYNIMNKNNFLYLFIGSETLDHKYYSEQYPSIPFVAYDALYFSSIIGFNQLLLSPVFYSSYSTYEFMLILQTDVAILKDELDFWCAQPFDYVGAPWPDGYELFVNAGRFEGGVRKKCKGVCR